MKKRVKKTAKQILTSQSQPVPMPVAASLVYHHLNRDIANLAGQEGDGAKLCSTALALSQVSDVYCVEQGKLLRIASEELAVGVFEERGAVYRAASGRTYKGLSMRRIDVMEALKVLLKARAAIEGARSKVRQS